MQPAMEPGGAPAGSQHPSQVLDLLGLALEHRSIRQHLVDGGIVDHTLGAAGEAQSVARLVGMHGCGGDVADDGRLGIAAQAGLQDARELGVPVGDVASCMPGRPGEEQRLPRSTCRSGDVMQASLL